MNGAFYIGATGLEAQQRALDVVANNIANVNTIGFKRSNARFSELIGAWPGEDALSPAAAIAPLSGVMMDASARVYEQGDLRQTGEPMDLAIAGAGFIELLGPAGQSVLWRGGTLKVTPDSLLAADNGMPLKALISVPADAGQLTIRADGSVFGAGSGGVPVEIGHIDLVMARDTAQLSPMGDRLFRPADDLDLATSTPGEDGAGLLAQGSLESSNVKLADEMVALLLLQRGFAANAQVLQAGDQLMSIANNLKR